MEMWVIWLIFSGICFLAEIATEGFLICWLGVGGLCAMGLSFLWPANYLAQIIIMTVVSTILILSTKKLTSKMTKKDDVPTNVYSILGKKAVVSQAIDNVKGQGQIKIDGDIWSARNEDDDDVISEGDTVEIIRIDGVKAIVRKI